MDPEILQLLTAARQTKNNKNMAGVLGNLDNPLLAFLAGIPAQRSAPTDMPLTEAYSNSADPVVQQILNQVNTGIDQYALSSWLASQEANPEFSGAMADAGWQPEDLRGLAVGLQKERAKGGRSSGNEWWAKAGLSDPSAVYDESNVPLDDESAMRIADIRTRAQNSARFLESARQAEELIRRKSNLEKADLKRFFSGLRKQQMRGGGNYPAVKITQLMEKIDRHKGEIGPSQLKQWIEESDPARTSDNEYYSKTYKQWIKEVGIPELSEGRKQVLDKAVSRRVRFEDELGWDAAEEEAIRRGRARAFNEAGRTPAADQVKTMLSFLSGK